MRVLRSYATLDFLFLYAPIAVIVVFSFSAGHSASDFHGFSLQWYATAAGDREHAVHHDDGGVAAAGKLIEAMLHLIQQYRSHQAYGEGAAEGSKQH